MHIAILDSNTDDSAFAQRHDTETEKFRKLLGRHRPDWQFTEVDVVAGDLPDGPDAFEGYIVTGSPASVNDPHPWVAGLLDFIRRTASEGAPLYGTCFGHQAIAKALGGTVEKNPQGWEFGRIETVLIQPWDGATLPLSLYAAHNEQVTALPPMARQSGETPGCSNAAFAIGRKVWTTQYHPEMTGPFVTALVDEYAPDLPVDVAARARASLAKPADEDAISLSIIAFFEQAT